MTTRANSQFPRPDLHRLDTQPYGLRRDFPDGLPRLYRRGRGGPLMDIARSLGISAVDDDLAGVTALFRLDDANRPEQVP
jgi:hypothetical protein